MWMTHHFATIVVQVPADPYLAVLTFSDTMTSQILVYNGSPVVVAKESKFFCDTYAARRVKWQV